ncbi:GspE/PulE family protein [Miltoncostaea oceani]|uniref:GspE/PulE family protein n=1 Tax=Miltoncostaea oceani TaxID=2843216 RepID=UPI001C3C5531|nr:GspE/PulE family protein [Miltoncostaea oceani]
MTDGPRPITLRSGEELTAVELRNRVRASGVKSITDIKLLEILVVDGIVGLGKLKEFVERAEASGSSLAAQALIARLVTEDDLARILSRVHQVPLVKLADLEIDPAVANRLDESARSRLNVLPIEITGEDAQETLVVACSDPGDPGLVTELVRLSGAEISLRVASSAELRDAFVDLTQTGDASEERLERESSSNDTAQVDFRTSGSAADSAIVALANQTIIQAREQDASDIHIEPSAGPTRIRFRIDGVLADVRSVPRNSHDQLVTRIKVIADLKIDERRAPQDGRTTFKTPRGPVDLRVATLPTVHGERVTMRLLDPSQSQLGLVELGLAGANLARVRDAVGRPHGLCITTGPTGSGKSTTLYAMLHILNDRIRNVITVEDPVEQRVDGLNQVQTNERANMTFASALRSILRSDPDVIMIGEIRDQETARIAVESAMTGHLVLSTLHTNSAAAAVTRLMEMGVEPYLISDACHLIMAQRLARVLCRFCREERATDLSMLQAGRAPVWALEKAEAEGMIPSFRAKDGGCPRCRNTGYSGRMGVHEVMALDPELKEMVMRVASADELQDAAVAKGMTTLRDDGYEKVFNGTTSLEEISRVVN